MENNNKNNYEIINWLENHLTKFKLLEKPNETEIFNKLKIYNSKLYTAPQTIFSLIENEILIIDKDNLEYGDNLSTLSDVNKKIIRIVKILNNWKINHYDKIKPKEDNATKIDDLYKEIYKNFNQSNNIEKILFPERDKINSNNYEIYFTYLMAAFTYNGFLECFFLLKNNNLIIISNKYKSQSTTQNTINDFIKNCHKLMLSVNIDGHTQDDSIYGRLFGSPTPDAMGGEAIQGEIEYHGIWNISSDALYYTSKSEEMKDDKDYLQIIDIVQKEDKHIAGFVTIVAQNNDQSYSKIHAINDKSKTFFNDSTGYPRFSYNDETKCISYDCNKLVKNDIFTHGDILLGLFISYHDNDKLHDRFINISNLNYRGSEINSEKILRPHSNLLDSDYKSESADPFRTPYENELAYMNKENIDCGNDSIRKIFYIIIRPFFEIHNINDPDRAKKLNETFSDLIRINDNSYFDKYTKLEYTNNTIEIDKDIQEYVRWDDYFKIETSVPEVDNLIITIFRLPKLNSYIDILYAPHRKNVDNYDNEIRQDNLSESEYYYINNEDIIKTHKLNSEDSIYVKQDDASSYKIYIRRKETSDQFTNKDINDFFPASKKIKETLDILFNKMIAKATEAEVAKAREAELAGQRGRTYEEWIGTTSGGGGKNKHVKKYINNSKEPSKKIKSTIKKKQNIEKINKNIHKILNDYVIHTNFTLKK